jgi:hypothetical protein
MPPRPRRDLTPAERRRYAAMRKRTDAAQRLTAERDQLILEGYEAGVDVRQMAGQLGISREAVYLVIRRTGR